MSGARTVRRCASCGDPTIEPLVVNGIVLCEICADDLPDRGDRRGIRQPRLERKRMAREDHIREARGW